MFRARATAHLSRRHVLASTVAVTASLALAACGAGSSPAGGSTTGAGPGGVSGGASAADATAATRTVTDTFLGTVTNVPTKPQRVVALWRTGGELADLGVTPVAQLDGELVEEEMGAAKFAQFDDVPVIGTYEGVDVEKIIAAKPDLIVGMDHGKLGLKYDELKEVAPTVILKIAEPTDVWDNYPKLADVLGLKTDFAAKEAALTKSLEAIATSHGARLKGLAVTSLGAEYGGNTIWVDTSKSLTYRRLTVAGFGYNEKYTSNPERYVTELTRENLPSLANQDVIFYDANIDGSPTAGIAPVLKSESFKRLPAVQKGHAFPLTSGTIYTFDAADLQVRDLQVAADKLTQG